ncbi:MAG: hypothetical protein GC138_06300 [Gammaproteobacteria bacterium]|nr:hypothetical protein [Gammaproteobacteria bacterium]
MHGKTLNVQGRVLKGVRYAWPLAFVVPLGGAHASGFALIEQSASGQGNAFSGASTSAEDPSVMYFNPAAMTLVRGRQATIGAHYIHPKASFTNQGSTTAAAVGAAALTGPDADGGKNGYVPNLYYLQHLNPDLVLGLGINAPFGLSTEYPSDWVGRYHAVKSELKSVNINPSIAWRLDDKWSFGAGVSAQYVDVKLSSAVDMGSACAAVVVALGAGAVPACAAAATPQSSDGFASLKGNDWSYGFNLGVLFEPTQDSRIGLSYRSKVSQNVSGDATFTGPAAVLATLRATGSFVDTTLHADVTLPESTSLGYYLQVNKDLSVMADWTWTHWSRFKELRIDYDSAQADSVTTESWKNTNRFSIGANLRVDPALMLRGGLAYDQTPVPDPQHRTARIPDNSRRWLSLGVSWDMTPAARLDVGYSHLFVSNTSINNTLESSVPTLNATLNGSYSSSVDIVSAQVNWRY